MTDPLVVIQECHEQIEKALWTLEVKERLEEALAAYRLAEAGLQGLALHPGQPGYTEMQRELAYCLMRQANILRQNEQQEEAMRLGEREISAARASGDDIALARSLMSNGASALTLRNVTYGLELLEEARQLFAAGESYAHKQGLGWYWILQADLMNIGLIVQPPQGVLDAAAQALQILLPLENWPGVARAYAARARAYETLGDEKAAADEREAQRKSEAKISEEKTVR